MTISEKLKLNHMEHKKLYKIVLFVFFIFYVLTIYYIHFINKNNLYKNVDKILKSSAYAIEGYLPKDFHDRVLDQNSISSKEDNQNIKSLSKFANHIEVEYLYTMIEKDGQIYFTSSSATDEDFEQNLTTYYFDLYESATETLKNTFITKTIQFEESTDKWGTFRSVFIPITTQSGNTYILGADLDISYIHDELNKFLYQSIFLFILFIILVSIITLILTKIQNKEIEFIHTVESKLKDEIDSKTEQLELLNHNLELKVKEKTAELEDINKYLQEKVKEEVKKNIQHSKTLEEQSKMAAMGEMIGNIAHQWRQPLSAITTSASAIQIEKEMDILGDKELDKYCTSIINYTEYLSQTIDDFRNFIRGDTKASTFSLKNKTDSFIKLVDSTIKNEGIQVILSLEEDVSIFGYPNELLQCFINIFNNSKDAFIENNIDKNERYVLISHETKDKNILITFKDTGNGIPDSVINKVFEPYFTTKHQNQGTGLGLHMTYNLIVNHMKGSIDLSNEEFELNEKNYKGVKFQIKLPLIKD